MDERGVVTERAFCGRLGISVETFRTELGDMAAKLLDVVKGHGHAPPESRAIASRALAYLGQPRDALADESPLGLVDDYVILHGASLHVFPGWPEKASVDEMIDSVPLSARERLVEAAALVLESPDRFDAAALEPIVGRVIEELTARHDMVAEERAHLPWLLRIVGAPLTVVWRPIGWALHLIPRGMLTRLGYLFLIGGALLCTAIALIDAALPGVDVAASMKDSFRTIGRALTGRPRQPPADGGPVDPLDRLKKPLPDLSPSH